MADICSHLMALDPARRDPVRPSGKGCKECLETGDEWVHLRLCMTCGHVGCCDSSPNKHATRHYRHTKHPTIKSFEPGEDWAYCYPDEMTIDGLAFLPGESTSRHYANTPAPHP